MLNVTGLLQQTQQTIASGANAVHVVNFAVASVAAADCLPTFLRIHPALLLLM